MGERVESVSFSFVEEINGKLCTPVTTKRKQTSKKKEYVGWGSKALIEFLQEIGKDASQQLSQYDVNDIVNQYINDNSLMHPSKKKRIVCDERLQCLLGKKTIARNRLYDLLGSHFAENQEESDDDFFYSSEEKEENGIATREQNKIVSERKNPKKKVLKTDKSCVAAIIHDNIKLIYLKKSLVQKLLNNPETFEEKMVGSFVRIKSDPNDIQQRNYHQLVQVTGVKGISDGKSAEVFLQVTNSIRDIRISMLSDDNFSEEECEDLNQRMKNGLPKQPTVEELERKAQILHEDIIKHWLVTEIALLQNRIDRANEKGWRRELYELLERRQLLRSTTEQSRLLREVPEVVAEKIDVEALQQDTEDDVQVTNGSPRSNIREPSEIPTCDMASHGAAPNCGDTHSSGIQTTLLMSNHVSIVGTVADLKTSKLDSQIEDRNDVLAQEQQQLPTKTINENGSMPPFSIIEEKKTSQGPMNKQTMTYQVIDLSDDDDEIEAPINGSNVSYGSLETLSWHYLDPRGKIQGPFSLSSLKRWSDANYFSPGFKVWKIGQSSEEAILLGNILQKMFPL